MMAYSDTTKNLSKLMLNELQKNGKKNRIISYDKKNSDRVLPWSSTQFLKLFQYKQNACIPQGYRNKSFRKLIHARNIFQRYILKLHY